MTRNERNAAICRMYAGGLSVEAVAERAKVSAVSIYRVLSSKGVVLRGTKSLAVRKVKVPSKPTLPNRHYRPFWADEGSTP